MKKLIMIALALLATAAVAKNPVSETPAYEIKKIEQFGDFFPGPEKEKVELTTVITILAESTGCTTPKDFAVKVFAAENGQRLLIERIKEDNCKKVAEMVELKLQTTDLKYVQTSFGADSGTFIENPIFLANPLKVIDSTTH